MNQSTDIQYNCCKPWQVLCFSSSNLVGNAFLLLMNFVSYLAVGNYGILVGVASIIITGSRIFDGITDPVIAFIVDKSDGKFGRYRPMMILGYIILTVSVLLMYFFCIGGNIIVFVLLYALYIIGYTFWGTASGGMRSCITNNPMQRGSIGRWGGIMMQILAVGFSFYMSNYLARKHQGINLGALQELAITAIILAGICVVLTVIASRDKDIPENYQSLSNDPLKLKDIWSVLKGNRNLQMMILAASSDKLSQQTAGNSAITVMIWGIIAGNYAFSGQLNMIALIPSILMILFGTQAAMKKGSKHATIVFSTLNVILALLIVCLFLFGDPTKIGSSLGMTALFLILWCLLAGSKGVTNSVVQPMLSDIVDDELYRTGKFMPGMVNATYSFIDKLITSLATTIVGFMIAPLGYTDVMPQADDPYKASILYVALFIWMGLPALGWICSLIAMKWYDLDSDRIKEIQAANAEKKAAMKSAQ